ncbi:MAG: adenylyltransferase/cytidyltransferase family protein [Candidatus Pacebacteria bacterium]|nr:adenylyltransferase/cytidyltransferase family protein [Candidatus Paceibacterota bacterium]
MDFSVTERTIVAVLAYSAQFNYPLTESELIARIFQPKFLTLLEPNFKVSQKRPTKSVVSTALKKLVAANIILQKNNFFYLKTSPVKTRTNSKKLQQSKEAVISELVIFAKKIPWVLGVVLTGSYAAGVVEKKHDLDFLIITKKNRLWSTRLIFLIISWLNGRRPKLPAGDLSYSWDFNFWLDETTLALPPAKRGIYEAYEILQTRWVVNKNQIKERFFQQNNWVNDYFMFSKFPTGTRLDKMNTPAFDLGLWLEQGLFFIQDRYRQFRHGKQNTTLHSAFLHAKTTKRNIIANWKNHYFRLVKPRKVLVTGVFDVLHQEHTKFLQAAKAVGDYLIVGLESDKRVKQIKGSDRPIFDQQTRKNNLEKLQLADEVFILPEKFQTKADHIKLIRQLKPDILAVSAHTAHQSEKARIMQACGGQLKVVYQHNPRFSTTKLISKKARL